MSHVLELFINLKTKKKNVKICNLVCKEVVISKLIPYCLFSNPSLNTI